MPFGKDWHFWIVVFLAVSFRILISENRLSWRGMAAVLIGAILTSVVGTDLVVELFGFRSQQAQWAVAAGLALVGEGLLRNLALKAADGTLLTRILDRLFGGQK